MHLMVNTLKNDGFVSSKRKIHSILFQETKSLSERLTESKKKCLSHLRKIAAGTSEDLLRNLCLCLESSPEELTGTQSFHHLDFYMI